MYAPSCSVGHSCSVSIKCVYEPIDAIHRHCLLQSQPIHLLEQALDHAGAYAERRPRLEQYQQVIEVLYVARRQFLPPAPSLNAARERS